MFAVVANDLSGLTGTTEVLQEIRIIRFKEAYPLRSRRALRGSTQVDCKSDNRRLEEGTRSIPNESRLTGACTTAT